MKKVKNNNFENFKLRHKKIIIPLILVLAAIINAFGVKIFMKPMHTIPVGVTGLAVIIEQLIERYLHFKFEYFYIYFVLNSSLALWAYFFVSKQVAIKSVLYIVTFTIVSTLLPKFVVTHDKFINIVSGGFCNGFSNVILLYVGGTAAGFNFIGVYLSRKLQRSFVGQFNLITNSTIIAVATFIFGMERGIMSFITTVINSTIIDRYHRQSNYVSLFIVTKKPNLFSVYATEKLKRSATILNSVGSYSQTENNTVILTISKQKLTLVKKELVKIDPQAHITMFEVSQIIGNMKSKVGQSAI